MFLEWFWRCFGSVLEVWKIDLKVLFFWILCICSRFLTCGIWRKGVLGMVFWVVFDGICFWNGMDVCSFVFFWYGFCICRFSVLLSHEKLFFFGDGVLEWKGEICLEGEKWRVSGMVLGKVLDGFGVFLDFVGDVLGRSFVFFCVCFGGEEGFLPAVLYSIVSFEICRNKNQHHLKHLPRGNFPQVAPS